MAEADQAERDLEENASRILETPGLKRAWVHPHLVIAVPVLLFILLTVFAIHGSSVAAYYTFLGVDSSNDPNVLYGQVRPIRSDEFLVNTPLAIAEERVGF